MNLETMTEILKMYDLSIPLYIWILIFPILLIVFRYLRRSNTKLVGPRRGIDRTLTYPRQYAIGWYYLCDSDEILRGHIEHFYRLGREMVAFRGDDEHRQVSVVEAYCVHLGANLGVGGRVVPGTNCIQCPFHLWEFDGKNGRCTKIPYLNGKIPEKACLQVYPSVERYGMIMIWYHPLNEPPHYEAICIEELFEKRFEFRGTYRYPNINMHLQEFTENAADIQHFGPLHGQMLVPWTEWCVPFVNIHHTPSFSFVDEPWKIMFYNTAMLQIFGRKLESTKVDASIIFHGPGSITLFRFDGKFGRLYLFHTNTPCEYTKLNVVFRVFAERKISRFLSWYIVGNWVAQWQRDLFVWENKIHKRSPILVKTDGPIMKLRRWFNQFYLSKEDNDKDVNVNDW
ncbi:unnamed protein product [Rotaria socialis]|uniref:cholesterol 7-desaturase n=1 Tax=Rotaria socialis TaxID=392032 RepID=A0A817LWI3_9BILA|nr:unnamed protein product [Rotaria socialis]CAF3350093.1 unnamed protein product [Rotaria socialis]CAF3445996.1 unnamed protein product [Rotaria socialis]CAF3454483.1 unnamed protein product [Rotaria socialis]CAF4151081.1 unnamed protein product [Rotaria socialis]